MKLLALIITFLILTPVIAAEHKVSGMVSALYSVPQTDDIEDYDGIDEKSGFNFGLGIRALINMGGDQLFFRTGGQILQKSVEYEVDDSGIEGTLEGTITYLSIPLNIYYQFNENLAVFGGPNLQLKLTDDCETGGDLNSLSCDVDDAEAIVVPLTLGMALDVNEKFGFEASYEYALTKATDETKIHAFVISALYHF